MKSVSCKKNSLDFYSGIQEFKREQEYQNNKLKLNAWSASKTNVELIRRKLDK